MTEFKVGQKVKLDMLFEITELMAYDTLSVGIPGSTASFMVKRNVVNQWSPTPQAGMFIKDDGGDIYLISEKLEPAMSPGEVGSMSYEVTLIKASREQPDAVGKTFPFTRVDTPYIEVQIGEA